MLSSGCKLWQYIIYYILGQGTCLLQHPGIDNLFNRKHVGIDYPNILKNDYVYDTTTQSKDWYKTMAMQHSCERNRKQAEKLSKQNKLIKDIYKAQTPVNGVLFGEISSGYIPGTSVGNCSKTFSELYQCTGIPATYTGSKKEKENFVECKQWWQNKRGCTSCKIKYPDAQEFIIEIAQSSGHFFHKNVQYVDSNGFTQSFDSSTCTPPKNQPTNG